MTKKIFKCEKVLCGYEGNFIAMHLDWEAFGFPKADYCPKCIMKLLKDVGTLYLLREEEIESPGITKATALQYVAKEEKGGETK